MYTYMCICMSCSSNFTLGLIWNRNKWLCLPEDMDKNVPSSFTENRPKLETVVDYQQ